MYLLLNSWDCIIQSLVLLIAANSAPILTRKIFGNHLNKPIDNGYKLGDGYSLLGNSKTWLGFYAALFFSTIVALYLGLKPITGTLFAILSMTGDLLSSFIKRRMGKAESCLVRGLDTIPESLLPLWFLNDLLSLNAVEITIIMGLFFLCEEFISPLLYKLNIKNNPY
jgi:CDP-2,3-bis-(O-geranylgeranyl)-sn-glycerol synthase